MRITRSTSSSLYIYAFVALLLVSNLGGAHGGTTTDGNLSPNAEWGASGCQAFDFIIVGAGAAGPVVAARLVAQNWTVLLLEAGGTSHRDLGGTDYVASSFSTDPRTGANIRNTPWTRIDVPAFYDSITQQPVYDEYNWNIANAENGKTLGGSMAHNGMFWGHPTQYDIQRWNVTGWSYNQFIPFIKKSENYTNSGLTVDSTVGTSGPIQVRKAAIITPSDLAFYNASISSGIPFQPNFQNGVNLAGVGYLAYNIGNNGTSIRQSSALKYLAPILSRPSLTISIHSQVTRVTFASCTSGAASCVPTANGVQFVITMPNGVLVKQTATAKKEVILAGGALLTPQILMQSGIGPRAQLTKFGITPVVYNENVGQNIRNHLATGLAYAATNVIEPNMYDISEEELKFGLSGTGVYAIVDLGGVVTEVRTQSNLVDPDIIMVPNYPTASVFQKGFVLSILTTGPEYALGTITLNSSNPLSPPLFNPNLANVSTNDVNTLVRGIRAARNIMNQPSAQAYFGAEIGPGPSVNSTADLQAYVRGNSGIIYHYYGSCKMGNNGDSLRVVNPNLQVVGTNNLRVIDASVIPNIVHAIIQATVVGIAEKGAASIISSWS